MVVRVVLHATHVEVIQQRRAAQRVHDAGQGELSAVSDVDAAQRSARAMYQPLEARVSEAPRRVRLQIPIKAQVEPQGRL